MVISSEEYLEEELNFLVAVFVENGYNEKSLRDIISSYKKPNSTTNKDSKKFVSLPFVKGVSNKLRKVFQKAGFTTMFKSGRNLSSMLTSRNKPKLPPNSLPGVYRIPCKCCGRYVGHTGKQISTRDTEHQKAVFNGNTKKSALAVHTETCQQEVDWGNVCTLSVQPFYYRRAVMEALEIQREEVCNSQHKIINPQAGQYVTTNSWKPLLKRIGAPRNPRR